MLNYLIAFGLIVSVSATGLAQDHHPKAELELLDINSEEEDFAPSYYGNQVIFTSSSRSNPFVYREDHKGNAYLDLYIAEVDSNNQLMNKKIFDRKINRKFQEGTIAFNKNKDVMVYTSSNYAQKRKDPKTQLQLNLMKKENGKWINAQAVNFNSTDYSVAHPTLSSNGKWIYFASNMPGGFGGVDLYVAEIKENGSFGQPINLGDQVNSAQDETFPYIHEDGILFFSSNRDGGLGGIDIYAAGIRPDNSIKKVMNAGSTFNSAQDDFGLILDENQHFGFLSSNRINGQGGDDIYSVEIKTPFFFGTTINGKTTDLNGDLLSNVKLELINADGDVIGETQSDEKGNFFIQTSEQGEISVKLTKDEYFDELQQLTDGKSYTDEINEDFSLEAIQTLKLNNLVTEKATGETVEAAEVTITDLKTNTIQSGLTDANGNIMLNYPEQRLSLGTHLRVEIKKEGFIANSFEIDTVFTNGANHNLDLSITKIEVGIDIAEAANLSKVESIFFDYNEAEILPTAEVELDKIVKLMNENPEIRIEIGSHTDARGSESFNMTLSKKRAKATAEYLRKRVDLDAKNRIRYKGYGESKLKNDCGNDVECTEEQHQENRRSEFIIIKI